MNKDSEREEISAFIDGEARDSHKINRLLQHSEEAAQYHMQLLKLSSHLQSLGQDSVSEGFVDKVLENLQEAALPRRRFRLVPAPQLAFAATLLFLGALVWWGLGAFHPPDADFSPEFAHALVAQSAQWTSDDMLLEELGRRMEAGDDLSTFEELNTDRLEGELFALDDVMLVLASEIVDDSWAQNPIFDEDLFALVENLDELEADMLEEMLLEYLDEYEQKG